MLRSLIFLFVNIFILMHATSAQQTIPLYEGKIPNNKDNIKNTERTEMGEDRVERVFEVSEPTLTIYKPKVQDKQGIGIIICPGGGYHILSIDKEGREIAHTLNQMGITTFVLKYRIPSDERNTDKSLAPLMDAQRAIQLVRENAQEWGVDKNKIGIMGFSAGGHLAATASVNFNHAVVNNPNNISLRPDFSILAYPVITMNDTYTHQGSSENLFHQNLSSSHKFYTSATQQTKFFSAEENINANTPPAFIFHSQDDATVPVQNAIIYYQKLTDNKIANSQLIIYPSGGHGYGLNLPNKNEKWMERMKNWLDILYP